MGAFGDNLRRERELRGITLAEISESTKISKRWLKALEDEDFEVLPGGVFNRGFVRAYAHFLGINEEETVADYIVASNEQQPPEDQFPLEIHEKNDSPPLNAKRSVVPVVLATVALVIVVGSWAFWIKHRTQETSLAPHSPRPAATPAAAFTTTTLPLAATAAPQKENIAPVPQNAEVASVAIGAEGVSDSSPGASNGPPPAGVISEARTKHSSMVREPDARAFSVVIKARENSWISISADGKILWEGTLSAHNQRAVTADKQLVLKTGNAAGIEVSYNGKMLGTLGKDKQVRTLTFNTAGLQQ